jgi:hypothetical protein
MEGESNEDGEPIRRRKHARHVRVARTSVGKGVFAQRTYQRGDVIGEIEGEVIDDDQYGSDYCMNIGGGRALEPAAPFRFVNHSCEPNCRFDYFDLATPGGGTPSRRVFLLAMYKIRPGEQLTIDYGWSARGAIPCRCGAASCRGWIVDQKYLAVLVTKGGAPPHLGEAG